MRACAGGVVLGVAVGANVGVGVPPGPVAVAVAVAVGLDAAVAVAVAVGVGVGVPPVQLPVIVNTMCIFGNPSVAVSVGTVIPQSTALK